MRTYQERIAQLQKQRAKAMSVIAEAATDMQSDNSVFILERSLEWGYLHEAVATVRAVDRVLECCNIDEHGADKCAVYVRNLRHEWSEHIADQRRVSRSTSQSSNLMEDYLLEAESQFVRDRHFCEGSKLEQLEASLLEGVAE